MSLKCLEKRELNVENNYNVYAVTPKACYRGLSFVAAENADEANKIIAEKNG